MGHARTRRREAGGDQGAGQAPLEQIAALTPDLIIGTNAGLDRDVYASLTKIAPTIANSGKYDSDWFEPWPTQTVMVGKALGKEAEAQRLVDELTKRFADEAAAHPQFAEVPAIFLQAPYYEGNAIAYQDGLSTDFLTDLGFVIPKELDAFASDEARPTSRWRSSTCSTPARC